MEFFGIGSGSGSLAGLGISLLPNPQTGRKIKDDIRLSSNDAKKDATSLVTSTKHVKNATNQLISDLPQAEKPVKDIQDSLTNFQSSIKPEVDQMRENVSTLTKKAESTTNGVENELQS